MQTLSLPRRPRSVPLSQSETMRDRLEFVMSRPRSLPSPRTPEGQLANYLSRKFAGHDIAEVAKAIGRSRAQAFNYLSGASVPSPTVLQRMAIYLGLQSWQSLIPPASFMQARSVRRRPR